MNSKTKKVNINSPFINICRQIDCQGLGSNILLVQKITEKGEDAKTSKFDLLEYVARHELNSLP